MLQAVAATAVAAAPKVAVAVRRMASVPGRALLAVGNMRSTDNTEENFNIGRDLVAQAAARQVSLVSLPEVCPASRVRGVPSAPMCGLQCFDYIGTSAAAALAAAEPLDGPTISRYRALGAFACQSAGGGRDALRAAAAEYGVWINLGGFHETYTTTHIYNTSLLIDGTGARGKADACVRRASCRLPARAGDIVAVYRKAHLFDLDLPGSRLIESNSTAPGDAMVVCDTPVGVAACAYGARVSDVPMCAVRTCWPDDVLRSTISGYVREAPRSWR